MKYLAIIVVSLLTLSCNAKKDLPKSAKEQIIGKWNWVSSSFITRGSPQAKVNTPQSLGYNITLIINKKTIEILKNGSSVATMPYEIIEVENGKPVLVPAPIADDFIFYVSSGPIYFKKDEFYISGSYNDAGEDQTFKKAD
jgi:hypothetical protein